MGDGGSSTLADSSGNSRNFGSAFSQHDGDKPQFGGSPLTFVTPTGVGGPLGTSGYTSTNCARWGSWSWAVTSAWGIGYNPPPVNYFIEIWAKPYNRGFVGGSTWIFTSGSGGGSLYLRCDDQSGTNSVFTGYVGNVGYVGDGMSIDTNSWTHLALVNDNGTVTFYTNGVACGDSVTGATVASSGDVYIGTANGYQGPDGLLDEARICTFDPGTFTTSYFLLQPPGPQILAQPQNTPVWSGGAAVLSVNAAIDSTLTYQWKRGGTSIGGAMASEYYLNTVGTGDNNAQFSCALTNRTGGMISSTGTLTVVSVNPANVAAYQNAVQKESSLLAYYPGDNDTGTTLTDVKGGHNGTLEGTASWDGRTNRSFGVRALRLKNTADGDVKIPNVPAFEFDTASGGNGTIEAIVYMDQGGSAAPQTIFSEADDQGSGAIYYAIQASADGHTLSYTNDALPAPITWSVSPGLLGRQAYVAVVFTSSSVTAYVDGQSLGTQTVPGFGTTPGWPVWIGSLGLDNVLDYSYGTGPNVGAPNAPPPFIWSGTIDELAVYGSALPQSTIQGHYSSFLFGTNTSPPTIVSQPSSKTLLAGCSPVLVAKATGTLPLSYQWTANSVPIPGATTATLALSNLTTTTSYSLTVTNTFGSSSFTTPVEITVVPPDSTYTTVAMGDHPTALWRLSETNGTTAIDSAGFNDGTYSGGFTLGAAAPFHGESGNVAYFNGSSGRAIVPLTPVLNPAGPFTIEFWASTPRGGWTGTGSTWVHGAVQLDGPSRAQRWL